MFHDILTQMSGQIFRFCFYTPRYSDKDEQLRISEAVADHSQMIMEL